MLRFILLFALCLVVLVPLDLWQPVQDAVILPFTTAIAHVCVFLMHFWDDQVVARANIMQSLTTGGGIEIVAGCSGVEAVLILVSAVIAFPSPWRYKLVGIGVGFIAIQALNLVRIISLYYLNQWNRTWFEWFHLYLWQGLIILDALVFWLVWLRWLPRDDADDDGDAPPHDTPPGVAATA